MQSKHFFRAIAAASAAVALGAPAAQAADTTSDVTGTVSTELSLSAGTPSALAFSHAAPATTSSVVTVTSTQTSWTLSISDNNTGTNSGHMRKTAGTGPAAVGSALANALQWSPNASTFSNLSGTPATVGTGSLVGQQTVTFRQALGSTEAVTAGDAYGLTVKYSVN